MAAEAAAPAVRSRADDIPKATFIEDVLGFLKAAEPARSAEDVLKELDTLYRKYQFMERNFDVKRKR